MIHLYIEHLLNIKTLSIQAQLSTVSNKETSAKLSADGKVLTLSHEDESASIELPMNISPKRASNVKFTIPGVPSRELSFRFELEERPGIYGSPLSTGDPDTGNLTPWSAGSLTSETEVCCANCKSVLVARGRVKTWKDLPSQAWAEMMEFWHCHKPHETHNHGEGEIKKGYAASSKLAVESGVGLVDNVDFLFAAEDCKNIKKVDSGQVSQPGSIQCSTCSNPIGIVENTSQGLQLHKPRLSVSTYPDEPSKSYPVNKWLACQILASVESQGVRKFTIQSTESGSAQSFKIWAMSPDLKVSSSAAPSHEPIRTMKILWHESDVEEDNESDMRKFMTESELKLRNDEINALKTALQKNSHWIPESGRELQGWNVGLLERFTTEDLGQWKDEVTLR